MTNLEKFLEANKKPTDVADVVKDMMLREMATAIFKSMELQRRQSRQRESFFVLEEALDHVERLAKEAL